MDWSAIEAAGLTPPEVAPEYSGRGIRVAVIDTGVDFEHPHVGGEAKGAWVRWSDTERIVVDGAAPDVFGHGTCCAGLIRWLAPGAELYSVRVTEARPATDAARLARGIAHAVEAGAAVLAVAMGTTTDDADLAEAVAAALAAGSIVVAPDPGAPVLPGICPGAMRVGYWDGVDVLRDGPAYLAEGRARPARGRATNFKGASMSTARAAAALARFLEGTSLRGALALEAFSNKLGVR